MDFIKETYDLLNYHLGSEHRGKKQLGPEHDELRKDIQQFVLHAFRLGKVEGSGRVKERLTKNFENSLETIDKERFDLYKDMDNNRYKSKANSNG